CARDEYGSGLGFW
nr:immunoglobulin heavy chain junction region [Macaca mulatta]MOV37816.1 immunoglobulin heavy chain junction region [Macaca mulatta]MOV37853.1 immunoglobulin heavy chain junction region [Macaca mulatta]MOV38032.1 immunoglobulin heavy chain junction region [Macaca mulatta]MOV38116.1 immunoglobulin heavy chain junction region [Macaca mulatta]